MPQASLSAEHRIGTTSIELLLTGVRDEQPNDPVTLVEQENLAFRPHAEAQVGSHGRLPALLDVLFLDQLQQRLGRSGCSDTEIV